MQKTIEYLEFNSTSQRSSGFYAFQGMQRISCGFGDLESAKAFYPEAKPSMTAIRASSPAHRLDQLAS